MPNPVSIRPSTFVEGGAVPVDMNLAWKQCRFELFDYQGKAPKATTALHVSYESDDSQEYEQYYSVGDPERFAPSDDGKTLVAMGSGQALSKSSNFSVLMSCLINAGFPENRLPENGDISVLDGLKTFNIGMPEPKRSGLARPVVEGAREKVLSVPATIVKLPWDKKPVLGKAAPAKAAAKAAAPAEGEGEDESDVAALAVEFVGRTLDKSGETSTTRQKLATAVFRDLAKDPNKDAIAGFIFSPGMQAALVGAGYTVKGEVISKPE